MVRGSGPSSKIMQRIRTKPGDTKDHLLGPCAHLFMCERREVDVPEVVQQGQLLRRAPAHDHAQLLVWAGPQGTERPKHDLDPGQAPAVVLLALLPILTDGLCPTTTNRQPWGP